MSSRFSDGYSATASLAGSEGQPISGAASSPAPALSRRVVLKAGLLGALMGASGAARGADVSAELRLMKVRHSTFLVELAGLRLLFDPWFSRAVGTPLFDAPAPAIAPSDVGSLDAILVTKAGLDRFDMFGVRALPDRRARCFVPTESMARRLRSAGFSRVEVARPDAVFEMGPFTIEVSPAATPKSDDAVGYRVSGRGRSLWHTGPVPAIERFDGSALFIQTRPTEVVLAPVNDGLLGRTGVVMDERDARLLGRLAGARYIFAHTDELGVHPLVRDALLDWVAPEPQPPDPGGPRGRLIRAERGLWYRVARQPAGTAER